MPKIPIFIIGINPRCGTHYLQQLLALHPDCDYAKHNGEDFLLYHADIYLDFIEKVTNHWGAGWGNDNDAFKLALESGLLQYLDSENSDARYVVTKTPNPLHANLFLDVFSKGYMIILVRRGQDQVESFMRSFNARFEDAVRGWKFGAISVLEVLNNKALMDSGRVKSVRYADLFTNNEVVMSDLLNFLDLDKSKYDFEKSKNLDVLGSSTFKGNSKTLTWKPIPKTDDFNPLGRYAHWSKFKHYRFNKMTGKFSKELGYDLHFDTPNPFYFVAYWVLMFYDFIYRTVRRIKIQSGFSTENQV